MINYHLGRGGFDKDIFWRLVFMFLYITFLSPYYIAAPLSHDIDGDPSEAL